MLLVDVIIREHRNAVRGEHCPEPVEGLSNYERHLRRRVGYIRLWQM
jgi:hypothetical protein